MLRTNGQEIGRELILAADDVYICPARSLGLYQSADCLTLLGIIARVDIRFGIKGVKAL